MGAVIAFLKSYGLATTGLMRSPYEGIVNEVWLTPDVAVRINKDKTLAEDIWTETVAVGPVVAAGIRTPPLLIFDNSYAHFDAMVTVYARVPGVPLAACTDLADPEAVFFEIGQQLRSLHAITDVSDPHGYLDESWELDADNVRGTAPRCPGSPPPSAPRVFCHQDLHPENILIHEGKLSAILDWGDAGFGPPATDFRFIPAQYVEAAFSGYGGADAALRTGTVWHQIDQFQYQQRTGRTYGRYGDSAWEEIARRIEME